jgi:hypothetical protein
MHGFKVVALAAVAGLCFAANAPKSQAQISVEVGVAPECPYGYYDAAPYSCAPYGYYGAEWFSGGAFVGAGPWFHGPANFRGQVDNHFHPEHGYKGAVPERGEKATPEHATPPKDFKGNETRDGHGAVGKDKR